MTLDEKVEQNTKNITESKRDVEVIKQYSIKNEEDHKKMEAKVSELNTNVLKLMTTFMEKM